MAAFILHAIFLHGYQIPPNLSPLRPLGRHGGPATGRGPWLVIFHIRRTPSRKSTTPGRKIPVPIWRALRDLMDPKPGR